MTTHYGAAVGASWAPAPPTAAYYRAIVDAMAPPGGATIDAETAFVSQGGTYRTPAVSWRAWSRHGLHSGDFAFVVSGVMSDANGDGTDIEIDLPPGWVLDDDGELALGPVDVWGATSGVDGMAMALGSGRLRLKVAVVNANTGTDPAMNVVDGSSWDMTGGTFVMAGVIRCPLWHPLDGAGTDATLVHAYSADGPRLLGLEKAAGDAVGVWPDEVGDGHLVAVSAAASPTLVENVGALAGSRALRFDGADDLMVTAQFDPALDYTAGVTIVGIGRVDSVAADQSIWHGRGIVSSTRNALSIVSATAKWSIYDGTGGSGTVTVDTDAGIWTAFYPGSTLGGNKELVVDGTSDLANASGGEELDGLRVGATTTPNNYFAGDLVHVLVFEGDLRSTDTLDRLLDYAATSGGVVLTGGGTGGAEPPTDPEPDVDAFTALFTTSRLWIAGVRPEVNADYCFEGGLLTPTNRAENRDSIRFVKPVNLATGTDDLWTYKPFRGRPDLLDAATRVDGVKRPGLRFRLADYLDIDNPETLDGDAASWTWCHIFRRDTTSYNQGLARISATHSLAIISDRVAVLNAAGTELVGAAINDTDPHIIIVTNNPTSSGTVSLYLDTYTTATDTAVTKFDLGGTIEIGDARQGATTIRSRYHTLFAAGYDPTEWDAADRQVAAQHARDTYGVTLT